jgi:hypothetical protein
MIRSPVFALFLVALLSAPAASATPIPRADLARSLVSVDDLDDGERQRLQRQVSQRRVQMNIHQALAVALIPVLGTTAAVGTANRVGMDLGEAPPAWAFDLHRGLAIGTTALYLSTAMFAITAPNPMKALLDPQRSPGFDSSRFHRVMAVIHAAFFVGLVVTGIVDARAKLSPEVYSALSKIHVIEGWTVFTLVTVSGITIARF